MYLYKNLKTKIMIKVGQKAPDFKLYDKDKNEVTLANFKGKNLVIFFFPAAWTGTCTKEMCAVQDDYKIYEGLNAAVVGVSVDTHWALKRFAEDYKISYPLLSDFNKQAIVDFDIVQSEFAGVYKNVAKRATFFIDQNGVVRFVDVVANIGDVPDLKGISEAIKKISSEPVSH
jgi:peroxiredoxin